MTSPNPSLYVVDLGGDLVEGRMGEDHEVVVVVGDAITHDPTDDPSDASDPT